MKVYFDSMVGSSVVMLRPPLGVPSSLGKKDGSRLGLDATYFGGERSFVVGDAPSFAEVVRLGDLLDKNCTDASGFLGQRAIGFL